MRDGGEGDGATIYAPATAPGKAGIAVVRISGPQAEAVLLCLSGRSVPARRATLTRLHANDGTLIDNALALRFEEGRSFTGEAVVEIQCHGGPAIVAALTRAIAASGLARLAEPGEFTRRAFANGSIDLMEVHAISDAIEAETELQRQFAMRRLSGEDRGIGDRWRREIVHAMSRLNVVIDFADEDLPADVTDGIATSLTSLRNEMRRHLDGYGAATALIDGFRVVVIGPPNVGKSSLLNVIAGRDVAIVSDVPGTTRDAIEVKLDLRGIPVILTDTAGLRETEDAVEAIGVERTRARAQTADLRIVLSSDDVETIDDRHVREGDIHVRTKIDRFGGDGVSAATGVGVRDLLDRIHDALTDRVGVAGAIVRDYEAGLVERGLNGLERAILALVQHQDPEIVVENLNEVARLLMQLIGLIDVEDQLDEIFRTFCLGK